MNVLTEYPKGCLPAKFQRRRKQFVEVVAAHKLDGSVCPQTIILSDGRQHHIDKYHDPHSAEIEGAGKPVMVYPVWMKGEQTCLFEADGRWWVLMKQ